MSGTVKKAGNEMLQAPEMLVGGGAGDATDSSEKCFGGLSVADVAAVASVA